MARAWLCDEVVLPKKKGAYKFDKSLHNYTYANPKNDVEFFVYHQPTARTFLSVRALALAQRSVTGPSAPLLAAPTHAPGWIDPRELVRRALTVDPLGIEADRIDQIQALLRLAPDQRQVALKAAQKVGGEFGQALRFALGGEEKIGAAAPLWIAAARARAPFADDDRLENKHPGLGPDAGRAARYQLDVHKRADGDFRILTVRVEPKPPSTLTPEVVTVLMNPQPQADDEYNHLEGRENAPDLRWALSIWPAQRESWFARAARTFANNLDWWEAEWGNRTFLEPLLDPDVPLRPMALLMLTLGLAAKDAGESGLATDALIAAIDDGRLDGNNLGQTLAFLAPTGLVKLSRWARTLGQAARISPLHGHVIVQGIQAALSGTPQDVPKDLHTLLELLKENLIELGSAVTLAGARSFLEKAKVSGKTARLAKELLGVTEALDTQNLHAGLLRALEHRLERAERWARRTQGP